MMSSFHYPEPSADRWVWADLSVPLAAAGLWILSRPFTFLENDGKVYAFMALARLDPARFGGDLFVKFGSQDSYSLFSPLYAGAIKIVGLTGATASLLFVSAALWLLGGWRLARALLDRRGASLALILIASVHLVYGGFSALHIGQGILTSRILAEALVLLALADLGAGAWVRCALLFILALAFHPLMAAAGLGVAFIAEAMRRPWLLWLGLGAALGVLGLSWIGVPPFDRLLARMDQPWLDVVQRRNGFIFLANWTPTDWARTIAQLSTVAVAAIRAENWPRRFFIATMVAAIAGLALAFIGGDLLRGVLVIQLQVWRAAWPLAFACAPALIVTLPKDRDPAGWVAPALLAVSLFTLDLGWIFGLAAPVALALTVFGTRTSILVSRTLVALSAFLLATAFIMPIVKYLILNGRLEHPLGWIAYVAWLQNVFRALLAPFVGLVFVLIWRRAPRAALAAGLAIFAFAAATWDQRAAWERSMMQPPPMAAIDGPVLWGSEASPTWFMLHRAAYASREQALGLLFSRQTALTWSRRVAISEGLVSDKPWKASEPVEDCAEDDPTVSAAKIRSICSSEDPPAAIISGAPAPGYPATMFETPADRVTLCMSGGKLNVVKARRFYVSRCDPRVAARP